jgi:hypothetical protein
MLTAGSIVRRRRRYWGPVFNGAVAYLDEAGVEVIGYVLEGLPFRIMPQNKKSLPKLTILKGSNGEGLLSHEILLMVLKRKKHAGVRSKNIRASPG